VEDNLIGKSLSYVILLIASLLETLLSSARSGFDSLRSIHAEDPQLLREIEVYIDGGCRRGSEVLQALAFGARGVGLGRPFLWAQAGYGEKGVIRAVRSESLSRFYPQKILGGMKRIGADGVGRVD
jgi:L-lactate dehydrogenase (cytochrome)